tara:strand:- start:544 stop:918 length:375 start_codon:yes stop_codon:yes gene_type:complete
MVEHTKEEYEHGIKCLYDKLPPDFTKNVEYPTDVECKEDCSLVQLSLLGAFIERLCVDRNDLMNFAVEVHKKSNVKFCKNLTIDCVEDDCDRCKKFNKIEADNSAIENEQKTIENEEPHEKGNH